VRVESFKNDLARNSTDPAGRDVSARTDLPVFLFSLMTQGVEGIMTQEEKVLYLVDGSSYIHRAFHAVRNLSNSKGLPTNAIFGFSRMLLKLLGDMKPSHLAVVFDAKGPTFRHAIYDAYKATRPPAPEDLVVQFPYIRAIVQGLGLATIEKEGYEADDIIGTLARQGEEEGYKIIVVTGDKDFRQIISPSVTLWDTMKDKVTTYDTFTEEYGLKPEQMIDVMGLSGDSSDNIPGVPGVGEKTAIDLVKQFGSLEKVLENTAHIKRAKLKENLSRASEEALLSKKLVTLDLHVPLDEGLEALRISPLDQKKLGEIFRELEFRDLWDRFAPQEAAGEKDFSLSLSEEALRTVVDRIRQQGSVSLRLETPGEDPLSAEIVGLSLSWAEGKAAYAPWRHSYLGVPRQMESRQAFEILKPVLEDQSIVKVGQDIKAHAMALRRHGVFLKGIHFDTMIASYVLNPGLKQHDLDTLAQQHLGTKLLSYEEVAGKRKGPQAFSAVDVERAKEYSCERAEAVLRLKHLMEGKLVSDKNDDLFYNLEMRLVPVLMDMEWEGIRVDIPFFRTLSEKYRNELQNIERQIYEEAGMEFNINSPQQLGYVLFEKLGLPAQKKTGKTKAYSTDVKVLTRLAALPYKIPGLLLRYRSLSKLKSTYLDAMIDLVHPGTGRIHTSFNQAVTATGRLSSSNPNLQNIPSRGEEGREIRKGFIADEGHVFLSADYSQIELRVFAHYSGDPAFMEAFRQEEDIHARTASEVLGVEKDRVTSDMRRIAKAINFGIIYGMGPQTLSEQLGIDLSTAKDYIAAYYSRYQGVARYREAAIASAREKGYVTTLFQRRRYLPDIEHKNRVIRAESERMAINTPIQGTAADLIKKAMIRIHERLGEEKFKSRLLVQVHDELLFEVLEEELPRVSALVKEEMEGVHHLDVPLKVDIETGRNWEEAH
jgi:DNA polymerase-1